jgi:hypothetical protein
VAAAALTRSATDGAPGSAVARDHDRPASTDTCTRPSSVPTMSTPASRGDSAIAVVVASLDMAALSCSASTLHTRPMIHLVHEVRVGRRRLDLLVVVRAGAARDVAVAALPALAAIA